MQTRLLALSLMGLLGVGCASPSSDTPTIPPDSMQEDTSMQEGDSAPDKDGSSGPNRVIDFTKETDGTGELDVGSAPVEDANEDALSDATVVDIPDSSQPEIEDSTPIVDTEDDVPILDTEEPDADSTDGAPLDTETPDTWDTLLDGGLDGALPEDISPVESEDESIGSEPASCDDLTCGVNGLCVETDGAAQCQCAAGYTGDGVWCEDIDECANTPCLASELCTNIPGSYLCESCGFGNGVQDQVCVPNFNLCGIGRFSARAAGTWEEPLDAPYLPMVDRYTTTGSPSNEADYYDCADTTNETGPEVVYRFQVDSPGRFHAEVLDGSGVDVDLHLLQDPEITDGFVTGCLARGHLSIDVDVLQPGEYFLVVDSWNNGTQALAGDYDVAFEWLPVNTWITVPVDEGLTWSRLFASNIAGGTQTAQLLEVSLDGSWDIQPAVHGGCKTVASQLPNVGARAGINASFYSSTCQPLDMMKADGELYSTNTMTGYVQKTMGWNADLFMQFAWLEPEQDWIEVDNAIGGYPGLVSQGEPLAEVQPNTQVWSAADWAKNPRTAIGVTQDNTLLLVTVDGRTKMGKGMTTPELALFMADIGAYEALNLDGGGSTTFTIEDCWINHVVNFPSDNKTADHNGARAVADGLYIR